jgi:hypothetical protein|uniref:Uncharacterized protein n=1 Tax=viral metagenome TaxID=1070528 RepID=A0A6C0DUH0_9ZZZZ
MPAFSATIRIRNNNQAPSGPVAVPYGVLSQIINGPNCRKSIVAYNLLAAGWQNNRVAKWNQKNGINYNC